MSNTNRDYLIVCEVKNSKITVARQLNFYITDKNTSNIFIKLVNRIENDNGVSSYVDIENATAYKVTLRIVKPNNETISVMATQLEPEAIYQVDLEENCKNIAGTYKCELLITTTVNGREELNTSDPFTYLVKKSILSDVGEIVETGGITTEQLINKIDTVKAELSSQIKDIANNFTTEQTDSSFIIKYGSKVIAEIPLNTIPSVYGNIITDVSNLEITEGGTGTFTVKLDQAPTKNQVINITSDNSKVTVNPSTLTFTPSNYNNAQTVTVSAENDDIEDNGYTLTLTLSSNNVDNVVVNVTVKNDDLIITWHTLTSEEMTNGTLIGVPVVKGFNTSYENVELPNAQAYNLETEQTTQSTIKRLKFADGIKFRRSSSLDEGSKVRTLFPNLQYLHIDNYFDYNGNTLAYYPPIPIEGMTTLEKVEGTIPSTVTNLNRAFTKCTNLTKVPSIPSGITTWDFAFNGCINLHNVTVESDTLSLNTSLAAFTDVPSCIIRCNDNSVIHNEIVERCGKPQINSLGKATIVYFESLNGVSPKNINCFGDSLTHGINNITPYPKYLQDMLNTSEYLVYNVSQVRYTSQQIKESYMDICYPCVKDIAVIWSGSNDENKTATKEQLVNNVQSLVNSLPSGTEYIVVGLITYQWSQEVDDAFEAAFGEKFLNMHDYLCNNKAFSDIGEAPTSDDTVAINNNNVPPSLIQNSHQTELGAKATAYAIKEKLLSLGYISSTQIV